MAGYVESRLRATGDVSRLYRLLNLGGSAPRRKGARPLQRWLTSARASAFALSSASALVVVHQRFSTVVDTIPAAGENRLCHIESKPVVAIVAHLRNCSIQDVGMSRVQMRKICLVALASVMSGCGASSSLEGAWRHERGGILTFRGDGSVTFTDTDRVYSGKYKINWKNKYSSEVILMLDGFTGGRLQTCNYQITDENSGRTLWIEGCTFTGILKKQ